MSALSRRCTGRGAVHWCMLAPVCAGAGSPQHSSQFFPARTAPSRSRWAGPPFRSSFPISCPIPFPREELKHLIFSPAAAGLHCSCVLLPCPTLVWLYGVLDLSSPFPQLVSRLNPSLFSTARSEPAWPYPSRVGQIRVSRPDPSP
jgi:hypothetical protein